MKPLAVLPFGEWLPDRPAYDNPGSPNAQNCLWNNGAYQAYLSFASLGAALPARCQGAYATLDSTGTARIYAGTGTTLYEFTGTAFASRGAGFTIGDIQYWKWCRFSSPSFDLVLATDGKDPVQQITPGGLAFAALAGAPPVATQIANVNQFVVLGDTTDGVNGHVPYRVQWCPIGNPTTWPYSTLAAQQAQAGAQFLNAAFGPVTHIADGYAFGLIFQRRGITQMYYTGDDAIFAFNTFEMQRGCAYPNSPVQLGNLVYFAAEDGFYVTDGASVTPIGHGKIDSTFLANVSAAYADRVCGSLDPQNKLIQWCYCSAGNATGIPDLTLTYNYVEQRFTGVTQAVSRLFTARSFGYTMDTLDNVNTNLDLIPASLDSPIWQGGNTLVGAFDGGNNYGALSGPPLTATIDTLEADPVPGNRTFWQGIRPKLTAGVYAPAPTVSLLYRDRETDPYATKGPLTPEPVSGIAWARQVARYGRASVSIAGGFQQALGVDVYGRDGGGGR